MRLICNVSDVRYRRMIRNPKNQGRFPPAWLTCGMVSGHGWGFLQPWAQIALFPAKGTTADYTRNPDRKHQPFFLLRLWPTWRSERHRNHADPVEGRYWLSLAWRRPWRRPRLVLLDPTARKDLDPIGCYRGEDCE
jgi:hypothetical protein